MSAFGEGKRHLATLVRAPAPGCSNIRRRGRGGQNRVTWLLVLGLVGHGFKSVAAPQPIRRKHPLWPPFCLVIDWIVAAAIAGEIVAYVNFYH